MDTTVLNPRCLVISWLPSEDQAQDPYASEAGKWVQRLRKRLELFKAKQPKGSFQFVDLGSGQGNAATERFSLWPTMAAGKQPPAASGTPMANRAEARDGRLPWTDFLGVYTLDYVLNEDQSHLAEVLRHSHEDTDRVYWIAQLELDDDVRATLAGRCEGHDASVWHVLPPREAPRVEPVFLLKPGQEGDADIQRACIDPLHHHAETHCEQCAKASLLG
jgi:hypothetical protein